MEVFDDLTEQVGDLLKKIYDTGIRKGRAEPVAVSFVDEDQFTVNYFMTDDKYYLSITNMNNVVVQVEMSVPQSKILVKAVNEGRKEEEKACELMEENTALKEKLEEMKNTRMEKSE